MTRHLNSFEVCKLQIEEKITLPLQPVKSCYQSAKHWHENTFVNLKSHVILIFLFSLFIFFLLAGGGTGS